MEEKLLLFYELLKKWNRRINLTSVDDERGFRVKHVEDSLALLPHISGTRRLVDLGSGAGIPGIILKIACPRLEVVLLEATRKKISFCDEAIRELGLTGIRAVWGRAEEKSVIENVGAFDAVVSRATWDLSKYLAIALPYIDAGGRCIAMKGARWNEELAKAGSRRRSSLLVLEGTHPYRLSDGEERCLIIFKREN